MKHFIICPESVQCLGSEVIINAAGETLADLVAQQKKLSEDEAKEYLKMILRGLSYIHSKRFLYIDLKPTNILASPRSNGIANFGLSRRCGEKDEVDENGNLLTFKGTPNYMSPESIISSEFNSAFNICSLDCILVEMVFGESVWEDFSSLAHLILKFVHDMKIPKIPKDLYEKGKDFIKKCFDQNPKQRWTVDMLLEHSYLRKENETRKKSHEVSILPSYDACLDPVFKLDDFIICFHVF